MGGAEPEVLEPRMGSREAERVRVLASVEAACSDGTALVVAHDLCVSGVRIETLVRRFQRGDVVRLRLPFLPVDQVGEITWTHGNMAGVRFFERLDGVSFRIVAKAMELNEPPAEGEANFRPGSGVRIKPIFIGQTLPNIPLSGRTSYQSGMTRKRP